MRSIRLYVMLAFAVGASVVGRAATAQRVADLAPAGAHTAPAVVLAPDGTAQRLALARVRADLARTAADSARAWTRRTPLVWPWYVLGGTALGAGTGTVLAVRGCPAGSGCRDDGGLAWTPVVAGGFALGGAVLGGLVGGVVDYARRHPAASVPPAP